MYEDTGPSSQTMISGLGKALEIHLQRRWIFPTDIGNGGHLMDTTKFVDPFDLDAELVHSSSTSSLIDSPGVQISTTPNIFNTPVINTDQASRASQDSHKYHSDPGLLSARTSYEDSPDPEEFLWSIGYYSGSGSGSDSGSGSASNSDINEDLGEQIKEVS